MAQSKLDREVNKAAELLRKDMEAQADQVVALAPIHNQAITAPERRPRVIGERVFEMTTVEELAKLGMSFDEIIAKLRIDKAMLHEVPDIEAEIRDTCNAGKADLLETLKSHLLKHSEKNVIGTIFALKAYGGNEFDEKRKRTDESAVADPQQILNGFVEEMLARKKLEREEIQRSINAEKARKTQRNGAVIVGTRDLANAMPVCTIQPTEDVTEVLDGVDQINRKAAHFGIDAEAETERLIDKMSEAHKE